MDVTATPEWKALTAHYEETGRDLVLRDLFAQDPERAERMGATAADLRGFYVAGAASGAGAGA